MANALCKEDTVEHYLKAELFDLLRSDSSILTFIESGCTDGMWFWDLENPEHEWMSEQFWQTLGYDHNDKQHTPAEWQDLINPDDLKAATENFEKHCADPNHKYDQIVRYRHENGSTVWIRCRGIAIRDHNGTPKRMLGAHEDVTQFKENEKKLCEANRNLSEFASVVSHDLRSPLRRVNLFAELLQKELSCDEGTAAGIALQGVMDGLKSMKMTVQSLYELSSLDGAQIKCENLDLNTVVERASKHMSAAIDDSGAEIEVLPLPKICGAEGLMVQLFQNLIGNSCKYAGDAAPEIKIYATSSPNLMTTNIMVEDKGPGIPANNQKMVFEPFKRLHHDKDIEGAGIGLSLCRRIVNLHEGKIFIDPDYVDGVRVVLQLPYVEGKVGGDE